MNIVKQGSGINHLPLLRAFKPPSKMLAMLSYTLYFLMSYERTPFHSCNFFEDELKKTFERLPTSVLLLLGF